MDDNDNPYQSSSADESRPDPADWDQDADPRKIGKAKQVPTVAMLMIAHGVFMFIAACCFIAMIFAIVPNMAKQIEAQQQIQRQQNPNAPQLTTEGMTVLLNAAYTGLAAGLFVIGAVNIIAGIQNMGYRGRVFGIISLVFSMGSVMFCWCLPFSIGLLIYGMIVYLSPEAERAFQWRASHPDVR